VVKNLDVPNEENIVNCYVDGMSTIHSRIVTEESQLRVVKERHSVLAGLLEQENEKMTLSKEQLLQAYDDERKEFEESLEEMRPKVKQIVQILQSAHHVVCYTGAGVSTSANIPDYRGPQGVWTLKEKGVTLQGLEFGGAKPTYTHCAITELVRKHLIHFVISTNMDGLHLRSGLPKHLICEQHGNSYKEICERCHTLYYRQYDVCEGGRDHSTYRSCTFCRGGLLDTIVHFGENLGDYEQMASLWNCRKSDVAFVMGTSMNVQPAASYPLACAQNNGKLIIVNLQKTPYDDAAAVRIFAKTDNFMHILMEELGNIEVDCTTDLINTWDPEEAIELPPNFKIYTPASGTATASESLLNKLFGKRT